MSPESHWTPGLVSIIVPVLGLTRPRLLRHPLSPRRVILDLLDDVEANVSQESEVIVVCNSRDQEVMRRIEAEPRITRYCLNSENVGVSRAWNIGAMLAEGEFLCFVNDDVQVGPGSIETLSEVLAADPTAGQAGPRGAMWPGVEPGEFVGLSEIEEADAISGFMFMTRRSVFDEVGGFDVAFTPAGGEEIDYSFAVKRAGYRCLVVPGLDIVHHGQAGVSSRDTTISFLGREAATADLAKRNMGILRLKWSE